MYRRFSSSLPSGENVGLEVFAGPYLSLVFQVSAMYVIRFPLQSFAVHDTNDMVGVMWQALKTIESNHLTPKNFCLYVLLHVQGSVDATTDDLDAAERWPAAKEDPEYLI